jgi:hypothetical protein
MSSDFSQLRDLLTRSFSRYVTVLPSGLQLPNHTIVPSLEAKILRWSPARTLYQNRKPICRSLNGIESLKERKPCASCLFRKTCTPQIYLELLADHLPLSLLIAYTSARNFLRLAATLKEKIENTTVLMTVRDRGRWGEISFTHKPTATDL